MAMVVVNLERVQRKVTLEREFFNPIHSKLSLSLSN